MDRVGCFFKTRRTRCDAFPRSSSTRPALCLPDVYPWFQLWVVCLTVHAPAREGGGFRVRSVLLATTLADGYRAMYQDMNSGVAR